MKWTNRGHEFDTVGEKIIQNFKEHYEKIYLFGAGKIGHDIVSTIEKYHIFEGFIDNNTKKQKQEMLNRKVWSLEQYLENKERGWIVITASDGAESVIKNQLIDSGLKEGTDFYSYADFITQIFPILSFYKFGLLYVDTAQISLTERCTLKCKNCAHGCYAVGADSEDMRIDEVCDSADCFFRNVDWVREFVLIGGEPLLYRELADVIQYIGERYRNKIGILSITTNGTIVPEENVLEMCRKYDVLFYISNYSETVKRLREKYAQLQKVLESKRVRYILGKPDRQWIDYGFGRVCRENHEKMLEDVFDGCKTICREVRGNKYYYCVMARSVSENLKLGVGKNDYLDLNGVSDKKLLFEFNMGCSEKGYLDMCRHCNGADAVNYPIPAAEQVDGRI